MVVESDARSARDSCLLFWHEELEGLSWFEVLGLVAGDIWIAIELQFARPEPSLKSSSFNFAQRMLGLLVSW